MVKHSPHAPPQTAGGSPLIDRVPRGSIEGLAAAFCGGASAPHFNAASGPSLGSSGSQPMGSLFYSPSWLGVVKPSEAQAILSNEKFQAGQSSPLTPPCRRGLLLHWLPVAWLGQGFGQAERSFEAAVAGPSFSKQKQLTLSDPHTAHFHHHQSTARVGPRPPSPHTDTTSTPITSLRCTALPPPLPPPSCVAGLPPPPPPPPHGRVRACRSIWVYVCAGERKSRPWCV